jgi:hypothetical protein
MEWGITFTPPLRADALGSSPHICGRCPGPPLGTLLHGHMQQWLMLRIPYVTPYVQKLLIWLSSSRVAPLLDFRPRFV